MIIRLFLQTYVCMFVSVLCHEGAHAVAAHYIALPLYGIKIGEELFSVHIGYMNVSPLLSWGTNVIFPSEKLYEKATGKVIAFFLSGPFSNAVIAVIGGILFVLGHRIGITLFAVNISFFVMNTVPLRFLSNDGYKVMRYLKTVYTKKKGKKKS